MPIVPDWLDSEALRDGAVVALGLLGVLAALVVRFVSRMVARVVLLGAIAGLAAFVWFSRAELGECAQTCECQLLGFDVEVPTCRDKGTFRPPPSTSP